MELSGIEELVVTNDALKYAKIIAAPIENEFQRKRAYASIVALDAFADYLVTKDITVSITKNLFKIAPVNEEFEISDVYYNGWKLDIRLVINDEFISIPKSHYKFDILPDFYVAIKVDKNLENAALVGFIDAKNVNKALSKDNYYLLNTKNLSSIEELITKLQTQNEISDDLTDHSEFDGLYLSYLDNSISDVDKKSFIKHISTCSQCRSDFVEFYDFEAIVRNSALCPEIFEDHTLSIVGGKAVELPKYAGKEEFIPISDSDELLTSKSEEEHEDDILGTLFDNSTDNLLTEHSEKDYAKNFRDSENLESPFGKSEQQNGGEELSTGRDTGLDNLSAGVMAAGALGAGAMIAGAVSASASASAAAASVEAVSNIVGAGLDIASSSAELLNNIPLGVSSLAENKIDDKISNFSLLDELPEQDKDEVDLTLFDKEATDFGVEIKEDSLEISDAMVSFDSFLEEPSENIKEIISEEIEDFEDMTLLETSDDIFEDEFVDLLEETKDEVLVLDSDELMEFNQADETMIETEPEEVSFIGSNHAGLLLDTDEQDENNEIETYLDNEISNESDLSDNSSEEDSFLSFLQTDEEENIGDDFTILTDENEGTQVFDEGPIPVNASLYDEFGNDLSEADAEPDKTLGLLDSDDNIIETYSEEQTIETLTDDDDDFMSFLNKDNTVVQDEEDFSSDLGERVITEDDHHDEFVNFISEGNEMKEGEDEGEIAFLDNEIQLSYSSEEEEASDIEKVGSDIQLVQSLDEEDDEVQFLEAQDENEEESSGGGLLMSDPQEDEEIKPEDEGMFISNTQKDDSKEKQELELLYKNKSNGDENDTEVDEQIDYIVNQGAGSSLFQDKKMIIVASCFVGLLVLGTVFGINAHNNKIKADKENAELANQQLQEQAGEINQDMNSLTPIPMGDATTEENLAKSPTANVPRDMNKAMTNVFEENPSTVAVTKISWEVSQNIAQNELFAKYLQIAGKNLQLNLKNDLINATEFAYNDKIKVQIIVGKDNNIKKLEVLSTSGSQQIDEIVLQSIKETLKYINVPQLPDSAMPGQHNLAKDNEYNLKLLINF